MSVEEAVTPTVEPLAAPSATVLAAPSLSTGMVGATSATPMVNICELVVRPAVAFTVML